MQRISELSQSLLTAYNDADGCVALSHRPSRGRWAAAARADPPSGLAAGCSKRNAEVSALSGAGGADEFSEFYTQLRQVRDYHRHNYGEVARPMVLPYAVARDEHGAPVAQEPLAAFSGEEGYGRYLDLHALHADFVNLKNVQRVDYVAFLGKFEALDAIPAATKQTGAYRKCV